MKFQSGFVSSRIMLLFLAAGVTVLLSQWAYAAEERIGLAEAIEKARKLSGGEVMSAFYENKKDKPGIYRVMVFEDGLPSFIELAADSGKQLSSDAKVKGPHRPDMDKALKAAGKLLEGEVEGIEFDPETGDYWVEVKLERGFSAVVLDGKSFKIKSMERQIFHDRAFYEVFGNDDIDVEFFDDKSGLMMLGDLEVDELMAIPAMPKDIREQIRKEFEVICEQKVQD